MCMGRGSIKFQIDRFIIMVFKTVDFALRGIFMFIVRSLTSKLKLCKSLDVVVLGNRMKT